jgi:hypothetical protein
MKSLLLTPTVAFLFTSYLVGFSPNAIAQPPAIEVAQRTAAASRAGAVRVLYDYVGAIASGDYQTAYNLHTPQYQAQVSYDRFVQMHRDSIRSIRIQSVEALPPIPGGASQEFRLNFSVSYLQAFPSPNGKFPELFVLVPASDSNGRWLIDGMAPGS